MADELPSAPASDQLDEQLVAYLDGELEPQAARQMENTLATDPRARQRLNQLAASWDLLDQLPRATVDDLFTRTTVEMVALAAEDEVAQAKTADPAKKRRRWLEGAVATLAAAVVGFVIIQFLIPDQNDVLLRDLPVVKNLELYRDVGDIDLLKQLQKANLFPEDVNSGQSSSPSGQASSGLASSRVASGKASGNDVHAVASSAAAGALIPQSMAERRAWVESLNPTQKINLRDEFEKFSALPEKQQLALRQLDEQLSSDKDGPLLRRIMQRYNDWLKTLTTTDRAQIVDEAASDQDRLKSITNLKQREVQQAFAMQDPMQLTFKDHDNAAVLRWMRDFADNHESELASSADARRPDGQKGPPDDRRRRRPVAMAWQEWWGPTATGTPPVTVTDIHSLHALLSPEKQQDLDAEPELKDQVQTIRKWIQRASAEFRELTVQNFGRGGGNRFPPPDRLKQFEEQQLTPDEQKELKGLTEGERMRKVMEFWQKHRGADAQRAANTANKPASESPATDAKKPDENEKPTD